MTAPSSRNTPPANEDIARVAVGALTNPALHIGKSYRPTGPDLLSTQDMADILGQILNRQVKYQDTSIEMFAKAAKALGFQDFEISQLRFYAEDIRQGAFTVGGATDHVELVTGQKPETFEQTARRYLQNPSLIHPRLSHGGKLGAVAFLMRALLSRILNLDQWERDRNHPMLKQSRLAVDSPEWRVTAQQQQLNLLLNDGDRKPELTTLI